MISDHDVPYVCINVRITRFVPRYKFIRNEKNFNAHAFIEDFEQLPLSIVYSTDDPDMQVGLLSSLIRECIGRHAPLKRTKVTRPPAPWMKDLDIQQLQKDCLSLQTSARVSKDEVTWTRYRDMRNELKSKIKKTKRKFYQKALSSSKPRYMASYTQNSSPKLPMCPTCRGKFCLQSLCGYVGRFETWMAPH